MISQFRKKYFLLVCTATAFIYYLLTNNGGLQGNKEKGAPGESYFYGNKEKRTMWEKYMNNIVETLPRKRYPDAIIIGAEKCGTSALVWFLNEHPLIKIPVRPEQFLFSSLQYKSKLNEYKDNMPEVQDHQLVMEKTPAYFKSNFSLYAIKETLPNAKIILTLCDPVNRTYSDFLQSVSGSLGYVYFLTEVIKIAIKQINSGEDFDEFVHPIIRNFGNDFQSQTDDVLYAKLTSPYLSVYKPHILITGLYYYYVKMWLKHYDLGKNFLILNGEQFFREPWKEIEKVQDFLGIPKLITKEDFKQGDYGFFSIRKWSAGVVPEYRKMGKSKTRSRFQNKNWNPEPLIQYFHNANEKLFNLIGERFDWQ